MKRLLIVCCCLALVTIFGCKLAPPGSTTSAGSDVDEQISQEQLKLLADIRAFQLQTDQTVQALMQEAQQREQRALAEDGLPGIVEDIAASQNVLADASEAAGLKRVEAAEVALDRLNGIFANMLTELPPRRIASHCERALAYLHLSQPRLSEATAELTGAYDVCMSSADSAGVQALIQQAKGHLGSSNTHGAGEVLRSIIAKAGAETTATLLGTMLDELVAAEDALDRGAWPVLQAELLEVRRMLDDLSRREHFTESISAVQPQPAVAVTTTPPAASTTPAASTDEPAAAGTDDTPATPATEPAATPSEPAAAPEATSSVEPSTDPEPPAQP